MTYSTSSNCNIIPQLYANSVSPNLSDWEKILFHFNISVEDNEVWEIARECKEIPHIGNVYQSLVLSRLENLFFEKSGLDMMDEHIEVFCFVNGIDTHFCINGEPINSLDEFMETIEEIQAILH